MKRYFATLLALPFAIAFAYAGQDGKELHGFNAELIGKLNLDSERQQVISTILQDSNAQRRAIMKEARAKIRTLNDESHAQISQLLSAEELAIFDIEIDAKRAKMMSKHKQWREARKQEN